MIRDFEKKLLWAEEKVPSDGAAVLRPEKRALAEPEDEKQNRLFDEAEEYAAESPAAPGRRLHRSRSTSARSGAARRR